MTSRSPEPMRVEAWTAAGEEIADFSHPVAEIGGASFN
jgi:hypothetical protein